MVPTLRNKCTRKVSKDARCMWVGRCTGLIGHSRSVIHLAELGGCLRFVTSIPSIISSTLFFGNLYDYLICGNKREKQKHLIGYPIVTCIC